MPRWEYNITKEFEEKVADYTGSPYAIAIDSLSNALFLCLKYERIEGKEITIPNRTYPSVPCEIIHAGGKVKFKEIDGKKLKGMYRLEPTRVWDSALRFTKDMYIKDQLICLSFTGPFKHLKLSKGGMILTDDKDAYEWFKKARFSGRSECSYFEDNFEMLGWNFYMLPEIATRGLMLMRQFYDKDGNKKENYDLELEYPNLNEFKIYQNV